VSLFCEDGNVTDWCADPRDIWLLPSLPTTPVTRATTESHPFARERQAVVRCRLP
jgi:hypothetical protein